MYAILISITLAIYASIMIDFTGLFHEIAVNADSIHATQALYAAEGAIEQSYKHSGKDLAALRNIEFAKEAGVDANNKNEDYLEFNEGAQSFYFKRAMTLKGDQLLAADAHNPNNRVVQNEVYIAEGSLLDRNAIYGLEPSKSRQFTVREVDINDIFNEVVFEYNQASEASGVLFEVFVFPREGSALEFGDFEMLKNGLESPVKRIVINTQDASLSGKVFATDGSPIKVDFGSQMNRYKNILRISGFDPYHWNYILKYQTLDNQAVHYKLTAFNQNTPVPLPGAFQTLDVIGATTTGLYQRVKYERESEPGLQPGLNFVHFSNGPINK